MIDAQRFWATVDRISVPGCWLWTGRRYPSGWPLVAVAGSTRSARRVAFELANDVELDPSLLVGVICGELLCIRPEHLVSRTRSQVQQARGMIASNTSGVSGVHWCTHQRRWVAKVKVANKTHFAGQFLLLEDAAAAVEAKRREVLAA